MGVGIDDGDGIEGWIQAGSELERHRSDSHGEGDEMGAEDRRQLAPHRFGMAMDKRDRVSFTRAGGTSPVGDGDRGAGNGGGARALSEGAAVVRRGSVGFFRGDIGWEMRAEVVASR